MRRCVGSIAWDGWGLLSEDCLCAYAMCVEDPVRVGWAGVPILLAAGRGGERARQAGRAGWLAGSAVLGRYARKGKKGAGLFRPLQDWTRQFRGLSWKRGLTACSCAADAEALPSG